MTNEIQTENKQLAVNTDHGISLNMGFMIANTLQDAIKISEIIANSGVCPTAYQKKPHDVLVALQMGAEVGLKPMQALQNIAVINGRPTLWGDAMLAICRQSKQFEYITERYDESKVMYTCIVKRKDEPEFIGTFSQKDAETAKLWGNNTWAKYPKRMLQMRARGFALRDSFPDLLRGIITAEEASDYPEEAKTDYSKAVGSIVEGERMYDTDDLINQEQLEVLESELIESGSDIAIFCKHYGIEYLADTRVSQLSGMLSAIAKKIKKNAQAKAMKELANNKSTPEVDTFFDELGEVDKETGEVVE